MREIDWPPLIGFLILAAAACIAGAVAAKRLGRRYREQGEQRERERRELRAAAERFLRM